MVQILSCSFYQSQKNNPIFLPRLQNEIQCHHLYGCTQINLPDTMDSTINWHVLCHLYPSEHIYDFTRSKSGSYFETATIGQLTVWNQILSKSVTHCFGFGFDLKDRQRSKIETVLWNFQKYMLSTPHKEVHLMCVNVMYMIATVQLQIWKL